MASQSRFHFLISIFALTASAFALPAAAASDDELLEPDKAFALTTRVSGNNLEATWTIAPGYYMYRDKFKFATEGTDVGLGTMVAPAGKKKSDPLFGTVETYTQSVTLRVPLERTSASASKLTVKVTGQGCNEPIGVCYPPITKLVELVLPAAVAAPATGKSGGKLKDVRSLRDLTKAIDRATPGAEEPIDPERAFTVSARPTAGEVFTVRFDILDCCYLYRDKIRFVLTARDGSALPAGVRLAAYTLPAGEVKQDEFVGKTEVYHRMAEAPLRVEGLSAKTPPLALTVHYQGCAEKGVAICYPPAKKFFELSRAGQQLAIAPLTTLADGKATTISTTKGISAKGFALAIMTAFGVGLLLTFTPCVLPMIPILSSVIVGSSDRHITKLEGGVLSIAYVLGTAVTYTIVGVVAGATGDQLQAYFQNPLALGTFAVILGALALSMFGFYELQMPAFIQSHLHKHSSDVHSRFRHIKGGAFFGVFGMGLVSALVVGACVSPLLISALGVAIANRDPVLGGAIMFSMALGMGVVLIAIGFGAAFLLPKAGKWMESVKHVFGVLLLGVAIYLLGFLPQVPVLFLWAALLIVTGVYMGATQSLPQGASGWLYFNKGLGTFLLVWGVLALLGGFAGNRDILNPFPIGVGTGSITMGSTGATATESLPLFTTVKSAADLNTKLAAAKTAGKPALLDYYATWCTDCVRMEKSTFLDPAVQKLVRERFVPLQVDVTDPSDPDAKAIKQQFGVFGPPAMLFFSADGVERRELRTYGYKSAADFLDLLRKTDQR